MQGCSLESQVRTQQSVTCIICWVLLLCEGCFFTRYGALEVEFAAKRAERLKGVEAISLSGYQDKGGASAASVVTRNADDKALKAVPDEHDVVEAVEFKLDLPTLRQSILEHSLDLKVSLVEQSIAQELVAENQGAFDWLLGAQVAWQEDPNGVDKSLDQAKTASASLALTIPLQTGASIKLGSSLVRSEDIQLNPAQNNATGLVFSISQPLLKGGGVGPNTTLIQVSKMQSVIANARARLTAIAILAQAEKAYWDLYGARKIYDVQLGQYDLAQELLSNTRKYVDSGFSSQVEVLRAEAGMRARRESVIIAETNLKRSERLLKRLLNRQDLPIKSQTKIIPLSEPQLREIKIDRQKLFMRALNERMELFSLELQLRIRDIQLMEANNSILPQLDIVGGFSYVGEGSEGLMRAWQQIGKTSDAPTQWSVGLMASFPLQNSVALAKLEQARLRKLQSLWAKNDRRRRIEQEVYDAVDILDESWARIAAAKMATEAAGLTYQAEKKQFQLGVITSTEVLEAVVKLSQAQLREVLALVDHQKAKIQVALVSGTVLGLGRIQWGDAKVEK
jgi:outer membrane protein